MLFSCRARSQRLELVQSQQVNAVLSNSQPLMRILQIYQINNKYGFDEDLVASTLTNLAATFRS